jgi:sugar phosphate isomerase/epimerase
MYKNLSPDALGVSGWQSELIELALTYGFKAFDIDIAELLKANAAQGQEYACRFLESAKIQVGTFDLPVRLQSDEEEFKAGLVALDETAALAAAAGATRCITHIKAASDDLPYHENFELHRTRLGDIADVLGKHGVQLGIGFHAAAACRADKQFQFIHEAEPLVTLIKTIGHDHVGLLLDTWDWQVGGGGISQLEELAANQIVTVRMADVPADADLATIEESQRLLIGESETGNSAAVLRLLAEKDYEGPVSVYSHPSQFGRATRESIVQKASRALDEQWAAAGLDRSGKVVEPEPEPVEAEA